MTRFKLWLKDLRFTWFFYLGAAALASWLVRNLLDIASYITR